MSIATPFIKLANRMEKRMTDVRETAERLAAEKWPKLTPTEDYPTSNTYRHLSRDGFVSGFLAGRTVSAEQVEAADALYPTVDTFDNREHYLESLREMFRAAGLRIEGEE